MKPKTAIVLVVLAGAGVLAWMYFRARQGADNLGRIIPQESGFDYAGAMPPPPRTRPADSPIIGTAVPRTSTGAGGNTAPAVPQTTTPAYSGTGGYTVPEFDTQDPYFLEA